MDRTQAVNNVSEYIKQGYHCSEAFVKGMGVLFPQIDVEYLVMTSSGFGGGVGMTKQNVCGLLVGGIMIISALMGRSELRVIKGEVDEQDAECQKICADYRARFLDNIKATRCCEIRVMGYGGTGIPCSTLARKVANIFLDVCDDYGLLKKE
jgi:hypothetical protein